MLTINAIRQSWDVIFKGRSLVGTREHRIARSGIGRKFQSPRVFEKLSVKENLALAVSQPKQPWSLLVGGLNGEQRDRVHHLMSIVNLQNRADWAAGSLSHGQKQWLEIAMLVGQDPDLLLAVRLATSSVRKTMVWRACLP